MSKSANISSARGLASLRNFVRKAPEPERCDLCSEIVAEHHQHLFDPKTRRLICTCDACAILFDSNGQTKYRRVPRDARYLDHLVLSNQTWNSLAIPIGLAFIYLSSVTNQVIAVYPSPAGPTESAIEKEDWELIVDDNPQLATMAHDVEALLINRMHGRRDYFQAPIDECYKLTGIVRKYWRGFSGGEEGAEQIQRFFDALKMRSLSYSGASYAGTLV